MSSPKSTARRAPLSRDSVLRVALRLADKKGIQALTMRDLGHALGVEGMALYRHFANKDEILDGILDVVLDETGMPSSTADWLEDVRRSAISVHRALERHPWAAELVLDPSRIRPARLRYAEALFGRLEEAGFSDEATYHAYHVLEGYVYGFSMWLAAHSFTTAESAAAADRVREMILTGEFPHFAKHLTQHQAEGPHREVSSFEVGLDLVLNGLEKTRRSS
jgi:AcrR family transcriptional regulator